MKTILITGLLSLAMASPGVCAQTSGGGAHAGQAQDNSKTSTFNPAAGDSKHSDVYYYFTMGHLNEQQFESSGRGELAMQAIDDYKKALELAPGSPVIMERLAEIYAKSQRTREAVDRSSRSPESSIRTMWTRTGCWRGFTCGRWAI